MDSSEFHIEKKTSYKVLVLLLLPIPDLYVYSVPPEVHVQVGSIVRVPLQSRSVIGIVWLGNVYSHISSEKMRSIEHVFDCLPISRKMCEFINWVSDYTLSMPGLIARMVLYTPAILKKQIKEKGLRYIGGQPQILTAARSRVIEKIKEKDIWLKNELIKTAGVSPSVIDGLQVQGIIEQVNIPVSPMVMPPDPNFCRPKLEDHQYEAVRNLVALCEGGFSVSLVEGVTGSGKTEVYLEAVAKILSLGKQVLILLPEITLTESCLERFQSRFGAKAAEWHSGLSSRVREDVWRQTMCGQIRVVIGARSALFLPFKELGLIIVDEEHDPAYKQEDRIFYNARDMSVVRGRLEGFPVILVSATPSIESQINRSFGRYHAVYLAQRYKGSVLPDVQLVDMRYESLKHGKFLSSKLLANIENTLKKGEQTLLFLNRRGYAPLTLCRVCGYRFQCPDCSSWLVEHRSSNDLRCHQCGYVEPKRETCPECESCNCMIACGPGVERISEEVESYFPQAHIVILSSDMEGGAKRFRSQLKAIAKGNVDIVIGTQLIAKGHNFPRMSLVGVVDGDLSLSNVDLRAAERTFQLLSQVVGRAGRFGLTSLGLIQVYDPEHPVMQALVSGDSKAFYECEIYERKKALLPPFTRLAAVIVSSRDRQEAEIYAQELRKNSPKASGILVFGPAEAPLALLRGLYRFRLLIHGTRQASLQAFIKAMLLHSPKKPKSVNVQFDIDPQSFL
ncbi:Helicase PriA [Liberibacter crescens BT-1]|uniref:Replication restart protein PriA n=1 Tax=Liberibacter crescens (strain BT-1) TaxID=1215343 RepID=L0EWZ4_LIBCB|nr:primosomal protein N' [Liberibacter crescens]AGA65173.1 Helicase PriA [Liberibacter crescens BT-1]AMC13131.1 primosome assembly protein PriA [Liberibacter crescens]